MDMKYILFTFFLLISIISKSQEQEGFYLTNQQHVQIKKNLTDYRNLIKKYSVISEEFEQLKKDYTFLKKLHSNQKIELEELKFKTISIRNQEVLIQNLENQNKALLDKIASQERVNKIITKSLHYFQSKYLNLRNSTKGERITTNIFWGIMVTGTLLVIYVDYEAKYLK